MGRSAAYAGSSAGSSSSSFFFLDEVVREVPGRDGCDDGLVCFLLIEQRWLRLRLELGVELEFSRRRFGREMELRVASRAAGRLRIQIQCKRRLEWRAGVRSPVRPRRLRLRFRCGRRRRRWWSSPARRRPAARPQPTAGAAAIAATSDDTARFRLPSRRRLERAGERERASRSGARGRRPSRERGRHAVPRCAPLRAARRPATPVPAGRRAVSSSKVIAASENTSAGVPQRAPVDPLGRRIGTANRRADTDVLERFDHPEPGRARLVGRYKDVARMQSAVPDARGAREIDRAGQLGDERERFLDRRGRVVPHRDVQRLGGDVFFRPVGHRPFQPGGDRFDDGRVKEGGFGGPAQRVGEQLGLFGDDVEPEDLDGDQAVAGRLICTKNGTKSANTNLMQHPEGAECWRRRESAWVLSGQRRNSSGGSSECNTNSGIPGAFTCVTSGVASCASLTALERL